MKILFIGSKKFDYLQDLTLTGLVKVLGQKGVIELNWGLKKHTRYYQYPKNMSYIEGTFFTSLITSFQREFDVTLLASNQKDALESYLNMMDTIPKNVKTIFVDGGDREEIGGDATRLDHGELYSQIIAKREFDIIFKREMIKGVAYPKNVYPLPFSFNLDKLPKLDNDLKYDVTFWAGNNDPVRKRAFEILANKFDCNANGTTPDMSMKTYPRKGDFYLQELARSKIALNFRGGGWDTLRYWEVPAVGRLMIGGEPKIIIPNNFFHEKHTIFTQDDLSDLEELITYYLVHEKKREEIAKAGLEHLMQFHTDKIRAEYILARVR